MQQQQQLVEWGPELEQRVVEQQEAEQALELASHAALPLQVPEPDAPLELLLEVLEQREPGQQEEVRAVLQQALPAAGVADGCGPRADCSVAED